MPDARSALFDVRASLNGAFYTARRRPLLTLLVVFVTCSAVWLFANPPPPPPSQPVETREQAQARAENRRRAAELEVQNAQNRTAAAQRARYLCYLKSVC